ncbi:hypothetical protein [Nitrosovibrio tenuis]|uniref:Uncharacterized protein n=1 Tax=Nitrosovibrio tenuis TaxID=1233 RepID=A0A1H7R009_9PROT|nr:hypothetical protein [Nitrosovibrio tenuis]SEL53576.1 hypothetical protein SAMN05216387_11431 [Nitrosovibrio tenuis]
MKFFSTSNVRSLASVLGLAGTIFFGVSGIAHAQGGGYTKENPGDYSDKEDTIKGPAGQGPAGKNKNGAKNSGEKDKYGMPKASEKMDTGYVDQKKRVERAKDPASPSSDPHVPEFARDKEGRPMKDPKEEQGGPIGPN